MKKVISFFKYFIGFIIGNCVFNFIYAITQTIILEILGGNANLLELFMESFAENMYIYILLYLVIVSITLIHNIYIAKKLNEKLQKMKERRK
ncbi:MAG: hypothetical protein Q4G05_00325 [Clostridia bacterium]|nr:hypothetical protein [Clostridia bacterium]